MLSAIPFSNCLTVLNDVILRHSPFTANIAKKSNAIYLRALTILSVLLRHTLLEEPYNWLIYEVQALVERQEPIGVELAFMVVARMGQPIKEVLVDPDGREFAICA